eukprot:jgi/Botrbrau1/19582/Bobra.0035s0065.1
MSTSKERELQALLKQKDAELEDRGKLLYKTKLAIEQLQQELAASRRDEETYRLEARKVQEDQTTRIRDLEKQLRGCQDELEARATELAQSSADTQTRQARIRDLEESKRAAEGRAQQLVSDLEDAQQKLRTAQSNIDSEGEEIASLQRLVRDKESQLEKSNQERQQLKKDLDSALAAVKEATQKHIRLNSEIAALQQALQAAQVDVQTAKDLSAAADARAKAAAEKQLQLDRQWREGAQDMEKAFAKKLEEIAAAEHRRKEEKEAEHQAQKALMDQAWRLRLDAAESKAAEDVEVAKRSFETELQGLQWTAATERSLLEKTLVSKIAAAEAQWEAEKAAAEQAWALAKKQASEEWTAAALQMQQRHNDKQDALRHRFEQERVAAELGWARRVAQAEGSLEAVSSQLQAKLAALASRLRRMAKREAKREPRYGELLKRLEIAEEKARSEALQRRDLEAALQQASSIFRRELMDKSQQLVNLKMEVKHLRSWQKQVAAFLHRRRKGLHLPVLTELDAVAHPDIPDVAVLPSDLAFDASQALKPTHPDPRGSRETPPGGPAPAKSSADGVNEAALAIVKGRGLLLSMNERLSKPAQADLGGAPQRLAWRIPAGTRCGRPKGRKGVGGGQPG